MIALFLLFACKDPPDREAECRAEGAECCADADCGADAICHFVYTCYVRQGETVCADPIGDRRCHDLCTPDSGLGDCAQAGESCQVVDHVQGGDYIESIAACF